MQRLETSLTEYDKSEILELCGLNRARRNFLSYSLLGVANVATIGIGLYSSGTVPSAVMLANIAVNGIAHFLKCSAETVERLENENKSLKCENVNLLSSHSELRTQIDCLNNNNNNTLNTWTIKDSSDKSKNSENGAIEAEIEKLEKDSPIEPNAIKLYCK